MFLTSEPANECATKVWRKHYISFFNQMFGPTKQPSTHMLEENLFSIPWYLVMTTVLPYTATFMDKVDEMISSGLVQKWHDKNFAVVKNAKQFKEDVEPQVLTVEHLWIGFLAFVILLTLSVLVFLLELAWKALRSFVDKRK
jgi:hypothetical protein